MIFRTAVCIGTIAAASGVACADFTHINQGGLGGSYDGAAANLLQAGGLRAAYGLTSIAPFGSRLDDGGGVVANKTRVDFQGIQTSTGDLIQFIRVHDYVGAPGTIGSNTIMHASSASISDLTGSFTDQVWQDSVVASRARVRYAGENQNLFTRGGASGASTGDTRRLSVSGSGANPSVSYDAGSVMVPSSPFRWLRSQSVTSGGAASGSIALSRFSDTDVDTSFDNMIAYEVLRNGASYNAGMLRTWLICFEDRPGSQDYDYNDLVVELTVIPLPPAAYAGLGSLACVGLFGMIRRRKNAAA